MPAVTTENLGIKKILDTDKMASSTFNEILDDLDGKVLGVTHESSLSHFEMWKANKLYIKEDVVRTSYLKSNQYLLCIEGGVTTSTEPPYDITGTIFTDGTAKWKISTFNGGEGANSAGLTIWRQGEYYIASQMVLYNNCIYRCKVDHISTEFDTDYNTYWQLLYSNLMQFIPSRYYAQGSTIIYNNTIYRCLVSHTASTFNPVNWVRVCGMSITTWEQEHEYRQDDIVLYQDTFYQALSTHESTTDFEDDRVYWKLLNYIPAEIPEYSRDTYYYQNQIVSSKGAIYRCIVGHLSSDDSNLLKDDYYVDPEDPIDGNNWEYLGGIRLWVANQWYLEGEYLLYEDILYQCNLTHIEDSTFEHSRNRWNIIGRMSAYIEEWEHYKFYYKDTLVQHNGIIYIVLEDYTEGANFTGIHLKEISTFRVHEWRPDTHYNKDDVVTMFGYLYQCLETHTSFHVEVSGDDIVYYDEVVDLATVTSAMRDIPAVDIDIVDKYRNTNLEAAFEEDRERYWKSIKTQIPEWARGNTYVKGDIVVYENNLYKCKTTHTSSLRFKNDADLNRWQLLGRATGTLDDWQPDKFYVPNDIFYFGGELFRVIANYQSPNEFEVDSEKFERIMFIANIPNMSNERYYWVDNVTRHNGYFYRCLDNHYYGSDTTVTSEITNHWERLENHVPVDPVELNKIYYSGDMVTYDGIMYRVNTSSADGVSITAYSEFEEDRTTFQNVHVNGLGEYSLELSYSEGDAVINDTNDFITPMVIMASTDVTVEPSSSDTVLLKSSSVKKLNSGISLLGDVSPTINQQMQNWKVVGPTFAIFKDGSYWFPRRTVLYNSDLDKMFVTLQDGKVNNNLPGANAGYFLHNSVSNWGELDSTRLDGGETFYKDNVVAFHNRLYKSNSKNIGVFTYYSEQFDEFEGTDHSYGRYYVDAYPWDNYEEGEVDRTDEREDNNADYFEKLYSSLPKFETGVPYDKGDIVTHDGMLFYHLVAHKGKSVKHYEGGEKVETNEELGGIIDDTNAPYNSNWYIIGYRHGLINDFNVNTWYLPNTLVWNEGFMCRTTNQTPGYCTVDNLQKLTTDDIRNILSLIDNLNGLIGELSNKVTENENDIDLLETTTDSHSQSIQTLTRLINELSQNLFDIADWKPNTRYKKNEWVVAEYCLYKCNSTHTSGTEFSDTEKTYFDLKVGGGEGTTIVVVSGTGGVSSGTTYNVGDVIVVDDVFYRCITQYTSSGNFSSEMGNWEEFDVSTTDDEIIIQLQEDVTTIKQDVLSLKKAVKSFEDFTLGNDYYIVQKFWNLHDENSFPQSLELEVSSTDYRFPKLEILQCMEYNFDSVDMKVDFQGRTEFGGYLINGMEFSSDTRVTILTTEDTGSSYKIAKNKIFDITSYDNISGSYTDSEDVTTNYSGTVGKTDTIKLGDDSTKFLNEDITIT